MTSLGLSSPAFSDRDPIPEEHGYGEANTVPPLEIENVPNETESLALVMDDLDAVEPAGRIWDHWVVWNIDPATTEIPAKWDTYGATGGRTDFSETGYGGPSPTNREHTYRFKLYALDTRLDLDPSATKADLESSIEGHVLDEALLEGTHAPVLR